MLHKKLARASTRNGVVRAVFCLTTFAALYGCSSSQPQGSALPDGIIISGPHSESKSVAKSNFAKIDAPLPGFTMTALDGVTYDSSEFRGTPTLLVFADTSCPCVKAYDERVKDLQKQFADLRLFYVFSDASETPAQIKRFAQERGYSWPIIRDADQKLLKKFDAQCTTETFLVDSAGTLRYHGRIDDNIFLPANIKSHELQDALLALQDGKAVPIKETRAFACTIPRVSAKKAVAPAAKKTVAKKPA